MSSAEKKIESALTLEVLGPGHVRASAPSNIALIKYMGKAESIVNRPANSSLSYTLNHLRSWVELERVPKAMSVVTSHDRWEPLKAPKMAPMELSEEGQKNFLSHFAMLKQHVGVTEVFRVASGNDFPSDCGLASSASSFAALTWAAVGVFESLGRKGPPLEDVARLSRKGSGSSCRSFFGPWVEWNCDGHVGPIESAYSDLLHAVIVVDGTKKKVSSRAAHGRVTSSLLYSGRATRAELRLKDLRALLQDTPSTDSWRQIYEISWAEFWDMHVLFETSNPSFGFMTSGSFAVLGHIRALWDMHGDGPLATMDAGANVHLLFRQDQRELMKSFCEKLSAHYKILAREVLP